MCLDFRVEMKRVSTSSLTVQELYLSPSSSVISISSSSSRSMIISMASSKSPPRDSRVSVSITPLGKHRIATKVLRMMSSICCLVNCLLMKIPCVLLMCYDVVNDLFDGTSIVLFLIGDRDLDIKIFFKTIYDFGSISNVATE